MPIRICQLITELRPGGAEACVRELATRLPAGEYAVEVAALRGGSVAEALRAAGVPVHVLGVRGRGDVRAWVRLAGLLRRGRFDVVHTHLFHADLAGRPAAAAAGVPRLLHTVHAVEHRFRPWQFVWARLAGWRCERIICVSEAVRDHHAARSGLPADRYTVIGNGVDAARFAPDPRVRAERRRQWGLGAGDVVCAFVGRLDEHKGIAELLTAFETAAARCPALHLVIAGDGPLAGAVSRATAAAPAGGRIRWLGHTEDVPSVLAAAEMFCQPSRRAEGFGLAPAEAMAAELPVVATDVGGLDALILHERTGLLCPPGKAAPLAEAIVRLADDAPLRARLGAAGRQRVRRHFTIERFIARHADLYRRGGSADGGKGADGGINGRNGPPKGL